MNSTSPFRPRLPRVLEAKIKAVARQRRTSANALAVEILARAMLRRGVRPASTGAEAAGPVLLTAEPASEVRQ